MPWEKMVNENHEKAAEARHDAELERKKQKKERCRSYINRMVMVASLQIAVLICMFTRLLPGWAASDLILAMLCPVMYWFGRVKEMEVK